VSEVRKDPRRWALADPARQPRQRDISPNPQVKPVADDVAANVAAKQGADLQCRAVAHVAQGTGALEAWRGERCLLGPVVETTDALEADYRAWSLEKGLEPLSRRKFMSGLRKLGHVTVKGAAGYRVGIALRPALDPDADLAAAATALRLGGLFTGGEPLPLERRWLWLPRPAGWCERCPWPTHTYGPDLRPWHAYCWGQDAPVSGFEGWLASRVAIEDRPICCAACDAMMRQRWG
jgi:hypothetical protein